MAPLDWVITVLWAYAIVAPMTGIFGALIAPRGRRIHWGALATVLPVSIFWLLARRVTGREPVVDKPHATPAPVHAPPEGEDLAYVPEPVKACPECGFLGIRPPGVQDGVWPGGGELILQVCPRCDYRGLPLEFARREDYADFLRRLARPPGVPP